VDKVVAVAAPVFRKHSSALERTFASHLDPCFQTGLLLVLFATSFEPETGQFLQGSTDLQSSGIAGDRRARPEAARVEMPVILPQP